MAGSVMASDAFFPFRDGIDAAAEAEHRRGHSMADRSAMKKSLRQQTKRAWPWCLRACVTSDTKSFVIQKPSSKRDNLFGDKIRS